MNMIQRFWARRRRLLESPYPIRALAVDPCVTYHQLHGTTGNADARSHVTGLTQLQALADGAVWPLERLAPGFLLFVVAWEPYCAEAIGALFARAQRDPSFNYAIVFLDDGPKQELADRKRNSWYFQRAFVPGEGSSALTSTVHRVPWLVELNALSGIVRETEGRGSAA